MRLSGLTSIVEPALDFRALYRSDISGMTRDVGVDAFANVNLNSGSPSMSSSTALGFNVTTSSRHSGELLTFLAGSCSFVGPVGVMISCTLSFGVGETDSKA